MLAKFDVLQLTTAYTACKFVHYSHAPYCLGGEALNVIRDPSLNSRVKTRRTREAASQGHVLGERAKGHRTSNPEDRQPYLKILLFWPDQREMRGRTITYHQHSTHNSPTPFVVSRFAAGTASSRIHYFDLPKDIVSVPSFR